MSFPGPRIFSYRLVSICFLLFFGILLLFTPAASGESPAVSPQTVSELPSLSAVPAGNTISLDLVANTRRNKPVLDLKPSDLAVTDIGSRVTLTGLQLVTESSGSDHLITLVFDRLDPSSSGAARSLAAKMLRVVPNNRYSIAVFQMGNRLRLIQAFTNDRSLISSAVEIATSIQNDAAYTDLSPAEKNLFRIIESDSLSVDSGRRANARLLRTELEDAQLLVERQHTHPSIGALQALAQSQRRIPGRKFVFWFSEGMRGDSDTRDTIRSVITVANRAGLTICAVDTSSIDQQASSQIQNVLAMSVLGVGEPISSHSATRPSAGRGSEAIFAPGEQITPDIARNTMALQFGAIAAGQSPLAQLATETGGIYLRTSSATKRQLQQLQNDLTSYYRISYPLPQDKYSGAFRSVSIRALRKNLVVRTRSGYFAVPPDEHADILPWEAPLFQTLAAGRLTSTIAFRTSLLHLGPLPDGNTTELIVEVAVSELQIREDANTHISSAHASILAVIKDSKGVLLRHFSKDVPLHESPDLLRQDPGRTITLQDHFSAEPGVYTLETAVFDVLGNRIGAQRSAFTIDPPAPGPSLSDIVLVRRIEPMHDQTAFDPVSYKDFRIIPRIDSQLPEDTRSISLFFLAHPIAGSKSQPQLQLQVSRNHEVLSTLPIELHPVSGTGAAISYYGELGARPFPPGSYQAQAVLTQDGQRGAGSLSFAIAGTNPASMEPSATAHTPDLEADHRRASSDAARNSPFVFVTPSNPVPLPSPTEVAAIVDAARRSALAWLDSLDNFFCIEVTNHSVDTTGSGDWKRKDTLVELIRYVDHQESRTTLRHNDEPSSIPAHQLGFAWSAGEYGGIFHIVFDPSAHASFAWKESDVLDGEPVQVFSFQVSLANSTFNLADSHGRQSRVGFHGLLYLDTATPSPRRITIEADDIPPNLAIRASAISVDYAWVSLNHHDYLLPVRGAVSLRENKHAPILNEFQFSDYRRFGSQIRILGKESDTPSPADSRLRSSPARTSECAAGAPPPRESPDAALPLQSAASPPRSPPSAEPPAPVVPADRSPQTSDTPTLHDDGFPPSCSPPKPLRPLPSTS